MSGYYLNHLPDAPWWAQALYVVALVGLGLVLTHIAAARAARRP